MQSIYDNQVKAYENMDDEYEYLTEANYRKHTDSWEIAYDDLASFCTGIKDFVVGFVQGAVDVVVGLMNVVIGLVCLLAAGITWGVCELCGLDKLDQAGSTATALLEDPLLIVEGISQGATDAVEQKGIYYCAGYLTGSIMADKGLSEGLLAARSTSAVSGTGTISTTGKLSAEGMSHVDDVTRAGVRSLDDLDDLARAGAKTLDSVEDVVSPTLKTLDKVEDASKPVVKTLDKVEDTSKPLAKVDDIPNPEINPLNDVGKKAADGVDSLDDLANAGRKKSLSESGSKTTDYYVGPNGKALPSQYKDWIGTNIRDELLSQAENPQLKNAIKQLHRGNSFIGDGGTADVIRFEQETGIMLGKNGGSHVQKGIDIASYIQNKILIQNLSDTDRALATRLLNDLNSVLGR